MVLIKKKKLVKKLINKESKIKKKNLLKELNKGLDIISPVIDEMFTVNIENKPMNNRVFGRLREALRDGECILGNLKVMLTKNGNKEK